MDKASAYGAGDCRFESYRGHLIVRGQDMHSFMGGQSRHVYGPIQCPHQESNLGCRGHDATS